MIVGAVWNSQYGLEGLPLCESVDKQMIRRMRQTPAGLLNGDDLLTNCCFVVVATEGPGLD
jgi:hypothetical protein